MGKISKKVLGLLLTTMLVMSMNVVVFAVQDVGHGEGVFIIHSVIYETILTGVEHSGWPGYEVELFSEGDSLGFLTDSGATSRVFHVSAPATVTVNYLGGARWWWDGQNTAPYGGIQVDLDEDAEWGWLCGTFVFTEPGTYQIRYWAGYHWEYVFFLVVDGGDAPTVVQEPAPTQEPTPQPTPVPTATGVSVTIDGQLQTFEVPPQLIGGRTMLPLRGIGEALGMEVDFDSNTRTAILTADGLVITHVIGTTAITVNGVTTDDFDVASVVIDNRTLVPARMIAEATGATVEWDRDTQTAIITTN